MTSDVHADVGAYVTDALEPAEREAFEDHLPGCERCRQEVDEFGETLARLTVLDEVAPPPALKTSLMAAIGQVRPLPPLSPASPVEPETNVRPVAEPTAAGTEPEPEPTIAPRSGLVDELAARRQQRRTRVLIGLVAAAVVAALALGGWAGVLQQRIGEVAARTAAERAAETELFSAADVRVVSIEVPGGGRASYTVSREQDRAMLAGALPATAPGKQYQLWTMDVDDSGAPVAESIRPNVPFDGGQDLRVLFAGVSDSEALAITVEDAGGAQTPTATTLFGLAQV